MTERKKSNAECCAPVRIIAKSSSPCEKVDDKQQLNDLTANLGTKRDNFALQRIARRMYFEEAKEKGDKFPKHRTASCWYCSTANQLDGEVPALVKKGDEGVRTEFIAKCKSVWTCPVCSHHIESFRRLEIAQAMRHFYENEQGKQAALITFTFPHNRSKHKDRTLADWLELQKRAFVKLRSGEPWQRFKAVFGFEGLIRGLETTYSDFNGWHPHTHEIWFLDAVEHIDLKRLESFIKAKYRYKKHWTRRDELLALLASKNVLEVFKLMLVERWIDCCVKVGLADDSDIENMQKVSVDVQFNASAGDYIAKADSSKNWGADAELASSKSKRSANIDRYHPFDFLVKFQDTKAKRWRNLFLEYSEAFKGKRHLYWSQGLKERVGLGDIEDEDLDLDLIEEETEKRAVIKNLQRFRSSPRTAIIAFETTIKNKLDDEESQEWVDDAIDSIPERRWCDIDENFTHVDEMLWKSEFERKGINDEYRRHLSLMYLNEQFEDEDA